MSNWIGLGVILFLVICGVAAVAHLSKPYDITVEEYERRAHEAPGLLSAGIVGLQKALDPAMGKAVEVQEDLKQGRYDGEQESGDPPVAGDESEEQANNRVNGGIDA
jgi:hypothetical protein